MPSSVFAGPQTVRMTSQGEVTLPILYYDVSQFTALFSVEYDRAAALLRDTGLQAQRAPGGKAVVGLSFFEYRKTSIGAYNEVGTAIAVHPAGQAQPGLREWLRPSAERAMGFHIVDLPVTTAAANAAGREIWGYPKFVTAIPLTFGHKRFAGSVNDPVTGEPIVTLDGRWQGAVTVPGFDLCLYSLREGALLRTLIEVDSRLRTAWGRGFRLTVGNSTHRMAENLRALGLDGAAPLVVQNAAVFHSRLPAGVAV